MAALGNDRTAVSGYEYETLAVSQPREWVTEVRLNRPEKSNAMNQTFWKYVLHMSGMALVMVWHGMVSAEREITVRRQTFSDHFMCLSEDQRTINFGLPLRLSNNLHIT